MNEMIEQLEDRIARMPDYDVMMKLAAALESLERVRLMRRIAENGIELNLPDCANRTIRIK